MCAQGLIVRVENHVRIEKRVHGHVCGHGGDEALACDDVENDERGRNGLRRHGELPRLASAEKGKEPASGGMHGSADGGDERSAEECVHIGDDVLGMLR
jgi:hypothetical protein